MWPFVPAIIFAILAALFLLASLPTPGGVNANVILILPAGLFGVLSIAAALIAWALSR